MRFKDCTRNKKAMVNDLPVKILYREPTISDGFNVNVMFIGSGKTEWVRHLDIRPFVEEPAEPPAHKFQVGDLVDATWIEGKITWRCVGGKIDMNDGKTLPYHVTGEWTAVPPRGVIKSLWTGDVRPHVPAPKVEPVKAPEVGTPEWAEEMGRTGKRVVGDCFYGIIEYIQLVGANWLSNEGQTVGSPTGGNWASTVWSIYTPPAEAKPAPVPEKHDALEAAKREAESIYKGTRVTPMSVREVVEIGFRAGQKAAQGPDAIAHDLDAVAKSNAISVLKSKLSQLNEESSKVVLKLADDRKSINAAIEILKGGE